MVLSVKEMKAVMAKKFREEGCCFTEKDIKIYQITRGFRIAIQDYSHIHFDMEFSMEAGGDYVIWVTQIWGTDEEVVACVESRKAPQEEEALIELAYHIAQTF